MTRAKHYTQTGWNIGPLSLFTRTNVKNTVNIAAWHNPRSITWLWLLHFSWGSGNYARGKWGVVFGPYPRRFQVRLGYVEFHFSKQRSMWMREVKS